MNAHATAAEGASEDCAQYLTFALEGQEYGVDILRVQEIRGYTSVTTIPNAPPCVKGVMNLRGTVVPVFDMRLVLGMEPRAYDRFTVIVVVNVGARVVGTIVDAVSDVLDIARDAIQPPPELGAGIDTSAMHGIARTAERLITLLDIDAVVDLDALGGRGTEVRAGGLTAGPQHVRAGARAQPAAPRGTEVRSCG